jgi:hypothetical protein
LRQFLSRYAVRAGRNSMCYQHVSVLFRLYLHLTASIRILHWIAFFGKSRRVAPAFRGSLPFRVSRYGVNPD